MQQLKTNSLHDSSGYISSDGIEAFVTENKCETRNLFANLDKKEPQPKFLLNSLTKLNSSNRHCSYQELMNRDALELLPTDEFQTVKRKSHNKKKLSKKKPKKSVKQPAQTIENKSNSPQLKMSKKFLVAITSNIWGTKFKFIGQNYLPDFIGQITYKTSLFHLQPRQMKIILDDLSRVKSSHTSIKPSRPLIKSKTCTTAIGEELENKIVASKSICEHVINPPSPKKQLNNLISIKTSATLGHIPVFEGNDQRHLADKVQLNRNAYDIQSVNTMLASCNDEIATVQQLVENKFNRNSDFFEKFNLPVLRLKSDYLESGNFNLITSQTDLNEAHEIAELAEEDGHEMHLLTASSVATRLSPAANTATTTTTSLTTTIYPKYHLKQSKFSLINKLNKNGEFLFSSQFFNYLFNRKNCLLEKTDYQKLDDSNKLDSFNSVNIPVKGSEKLESNTDEAAAARKEEDSEEAINQPTIESDKSTKSKILNSKKKNSLKNQFILHNKPPIWNETNQVIYIINKFFYFKKVVYEIETK